MLRFFVLLLLLSLFIQIKAQIATKALAIGTTSQDNIRATFVDDDNNIYILGAGAGQLKVGDSTFSSPPTSSVYNYLVKLNSNQKVVWHYTSKYWNNSLSCDAKITIGENKSVYFTDSYTGTMSNDSVSYTPYGNGLGYFTCKLDSLGNYQWSMNQGGEAIRYDSTGYIEIRNFSSYNDTLDNEHITNESGTVAWFDTAGNYIDHMQIDDPSYGQEIIKGRDRDGNYFGYRRVLERRITTRNALELFKVDSAGTLIESRFIQSCGGLDNPSTLTTDMDNGGYYFICNLMDNFPLSDPIPITFPMMKLVKTDANFNVTGILNLGSTGAISGAEQNVAVQVIDGDIIITGKISNYNLWTSFGQSNYIYPINNKLIMAKLSSNLSYKWHKEIPVLYYASALYGALPYKGELLLYGQHDDFTIDGNFCDVFYTLDAFIITMNDNDSTKIEVKGNIFYDIENNGINTSVDLPMPFIAVENTSLISSLFFTNITGAYTANGVFGSQFIKTPTLPLYWQRTTPDSLLVNANSTDTIINNIDFGYRPIPGIKDLQIDIIPLAEPRPGFHTYYKYEVCNIGTDTLSPNLCIKQDPALIFLNSSISPDSILGDSLLFFLPSMAPNSCIQIHITDSVSVASNIGDIITQYATVTPIVNDTTPQDNSEFLTEIVISSYDPNDITVFPKCDISDGFVQNENNLEYLIRFQNTGDAEAINITIKDTLHAELDLSSIRYISSSNNVVFSIVENVLIIQFDSIMLAPSSMSEQDSKGYFKYSIKALTNIGIGSTIKNKVRIFFDYNAPIITNTTSTTIVATEDLVILNVTPSSCALINDGSIHFLSNCMEGDLFASINSDPFSIVPNQLFDNLFTGNYEIVITNGVDTSFIDSVYVGSTAIITNRNKTICQGDSALLEGTYQNIAGIYIDSLQTINGCDSILSTTLSISPIFTSTQNNSICQGDSLLIYGSYQNIAGIYIDSLQTISGCDSVLSTTLTVEPLPSVNITSFDPDTICENANVIGLPNATPIDGNYYGNGVINDSFDPSAAGIGTHAIIYTYTDVNLCLNSDTTFITVDICSGINNISTDFGIIIYPNPSTGLFTIEKTNNLDKEMQVRLLDITSKVILEKNIPIGQLKVEMDIKNYSKGIYYLYIIIEDKQFIKQIIKK